MHFSPRSPVDVPGPKRARSAFIWPIGIVATVLTIAIAFHAVIPGSIGTLNASMLPWLGWFVPTLMISALLLKHRRLILFTAIPAFAWLIVVMPTALPLGSFATAEVTLSVATQNVRGSASAAAASAKTLVEADAEVIGLVELTGDARASAAAELESSHPNSFQVGTVGLWSMLPTRVRASARTGPRVAQGALSRCRNSERHSERLCRACGMVSTWQPSGSAWTNQTIPRRDCATQKQG